MKKEEQLYCTEAKEMKYCLLIFFMATVFVGVSASAVEKGDTREAVIAELGQPQGMIKADDYELLTYGRGKVEIRDGVVVSSNLMTAEELTARRRSAAIAAEQARIAASERRERNRQRGLEVKAKMIESPAFLEASGNRRVEILNGFHRQYPSVDITELLLPAMAEKMEEDKERRAEAKRKKEIADLEKRVEDAEWEAQQARWDASTARAEVQDALRARYYWQQYNNRYHHPHPYYRPRIGGLSIGYESPDIKINYSSGSSVFNHQIYGRKTGSSISQHKIYSSSSSFPGF